MTAPATTEGRLGGASKRVVLVVSVLALLAGGCTGAGERAPSPAESQRDGFPVEVQAANGKVVVPRRPTRIVSLSPTATEILFAIGAGPQVVAVDDRSSYPAEAPRTSLSGFTPNLEGIASFRPDLVVYSSEPGNLGSGLDDFGFPGILQPAAAGLDDTYRQILELGTATGRNTRAAELVEEMEGQIEEIVESLPRFPRAPSYYHELDENFFTATSKTYIGEAYTLLGLANIADPADRLGSGYVQLSGEFIIKSDPDLILLADARCCGQSAQTLAARPGWSRMRAVTDGVVIPLDDDIASRWGPRTVEFIRSIAQGLNSFEPQLRSPESP